MGAPIKYCRYCESYKYTNEDYKLEFKIFWKKHRLSKNDSGGLLFCTWLVREGDQLAKGSRKLNRVGIT